MPRSSKAPEPWHSFLGELDQEATEQTRLDCMGGIVATILYGLARATSDLDVLPIAPREQRTPLLELGARGSRLHMKHKIYLDYVGVAKVPEDHQERLTEKFQRACTHLRICALDPYDLAPSKLQRKIHRDPHHVRHLAHSIPQRLQALTHH